ncbi:M20 family metallopeptidase [Nonomuraea aurantiaca]|uniref:M20 family metallopeptidase n=1 Tax=Nonomuraea aurantiaca TaxID=2878562 RepID=UPI001CD9DBBF|nr:M20 family metallopeptidase [Nonomuraea aurantiaca]MCA2221669.1 M20 family metallopeptidase [Nonomuraea aurantiaca]
MTPAPTWTRQALPSMLDDLRMLVELESPSNDKQLLDGALDAIFRWAVDRAGEPDEFTRHDGGRHGDVLELTYQGTAPGFVLLVGHYDTVWPVGTLADWPWQVTDGVISAPGVFDMKTGLVQAVWAVRGLRELGLPHPTVRLLFNGDEEIGSPASRARIEAASDGALASLVFEGAIDGAVKTSRKGVGIFQVSVTGIEAHAGLDPTAGASAIHAMADLITQIAALGAPALGTTVNVGLVSGGTGTNVTAGQATCGIDVRVSDPAEMARVDAALTSLRAPDPRVSVALSGEWNRPPMTPNPASQDLYARTYKVAIEHGWDLREAGVGGASDANFISALGRPVLDGLGPVGAGSHSRGEHTIVEYIPERTALTIGLIAGFAS